MLGDEDCCENSSRTRVPHSKSPFKLCRRRIEEDDENLKMKKVQKKTAKNILYTTRKNHSSSSSIVFNGDLVFSYLHDPSHTNYARNRGPAFCPPFTHCISNKKGKLQ